jgi:mono/diheme cytochrome c family protein
MCKLCWVLVLVLLVGVSVVGYKVFVGPPMDTSADGRRVIRISEQERSLVLVEMRGFLASVQQITAALAVNDMQQVAEQARRSGRAAQHAVPPLLIAKLPAPFKKMGFDTHAGFDQLALDAEQLGDREHSLAQLGELMQNCVVCHGAYRIDPEPEPQTGDDG